ncbi:UNVERIFIED_CONTAM: hypothetical protein PYX00_010113 [Menopon gallinae]|uniref:Peroxisomal membrane protein PEX14 n=1 Tax=Menopon gallinae TaxID=328185 RepID=A0AAW2HE24_9NEOP
MDIAQSNNGGDTCGVYGKMSSKEVAIEVQGSIRENMIQTAVDFLNNPSIRTSSDVKKESFLKKKGLTSDEIRIAFERSNSKLSAVPFRHDAHMAFPPPQGSQFEFSWFQRLKDVSLILGASYGLYCFYKMYISPFLFDQSRKPKSIENSISDINDTMKKSIDELKSNIQQVHSELERVMTSQTEQQNYVREISQLKSEIATVKGILLSRHQFPSVSLTTASIPAWQLTGSSHKDDKEILESEDVEHISGSSETEMVPNSNRNGGSQGSDSSLEMIKEVDG